MITKTYSLAEAAEILRGSATPWDIEWLRRQLKAGVLPGFKPGRHWRMTAAHIDATVEILEPQQVSLPEVPQLSGMTRTSRRRLSA